MKSTASLLQRWYLGGCRPRLILKVLSVLILVFTASSSVSAQASDSRQLSLKHPEDSEFEFLLNRYYPGFLNLDTYRAIRPFLVVLQNGTTHRATAYVIEWEIRSSEGMVNRLQNQYIQKHFAPAKERGALVTGELRLISPFFNIGPAEYNLQHDRIARLLPTFSSHPPYSSTNIESITATVDAVIYEDGAYVGPDRFQLLPRYRAEREAERDEGAAVVQLLAANTPPDDIVAALGRDVQSGLSVNLSPTRDPDALYAMYYWVQRGYGAQALLAQFRKSGMDALKKRASAMASHPRETISRLPQD